MTNFFFKSCAGYPADNINVEETVKKVTELITREENLYPALKTSLEVFILLISILINRLGLNSRTPVTDPDRKENPRKGNDLKQVDNPARMAKRLREHRMIAQHLHSRQKIILRQSEERDVEVNAIL